MTFRRDSRNWLMVWLTSLMLVVLLAMTVAAGQWQPTLRFEGQVGSSRNLGTAQIMTPLFQSENQLVYLDLRGVVASDPSREANLGLGYRWGSQDDAWIWGLHLFADRRETASGNLWNQVTAGVEMLGRDTQFRINAYVPQTGKQLAGVQVDDAIVISGTQLIYEDAYLETYETAMSGIEVGITRRLRGWGDDSRLSARGFHFQAPDARAVTGANLRFESRFNDVWNVRGSQLILGVEGQTDTVRGAQGAVTLGFSLPIGKGVAPSVTPAADPEFRSRMMEPVQRDIDIVVTTMEPVRVIESHSDPIDAASGEAVTGILFVSAAGDADAEGDIADPLNVAGVNDRLSDAAQDGVRGILVVPIGADKIHTGDQGLVLMPGNILMSKGNLAFKSTASGREVTLVREVDPTILVNDDHRPVIVVTSNNSIVGIETQGGGYSVYGGDDLGYGKLSGTIRLDSVTFDEAAIAAVLLSGAEGNSLGLHIVDSEISGEGGIIVDAVGASGVDVALINSTVFARGVPVVDIWDGFDVAGLGFYLDVEAERADVGVTIENSTIDAAAYGAFIWSGPDTGNVDIAVSKSTITSREDGISIAIGTDSVSVNATLTGNVIDAGGDGIYVSASTEQGILTADFSGNVIDAGDDGIYIYTSVEEGVVTAAFSDNVIDAEGDGIEVLASTAEAFVTAAFSANEIDAEGDGIDISAYTDDGIVTTAFSDNVIDAGDDGIEIYTSVVEGIVTAAFSANKINSGDFGVDVDISMDDGNVEVSLLNNIITSADGGMNVELVSDSGALNATFTGNEIDAGDKGISSWIRSEGGDVTATYSGNQIVAEDFGIHTTMWGEQVDETFVANTIDAGGTGIFAGFSLYELDSPVNVVVAENEIRANEDGIVVTAFSTFSASDFNIEIDNNIVVANAGGDAADAHGISVKLDAPDIAAIAVSDNHLTVDGGTGISLDVAAVGDQRTYISVVDNLVHASKNGAIIAVDHHDGWVTFSDNDVSALERGLSVLARTGAAAFTAIIDNIFRAMETAAVALTAEDEAIIEWQIRDNEYLGLSDDAVELEENEAGGTVRPRI